MNSDVERTSLGQSFSLPPPHLSHVQAHTLSNHYYSFVIQIVIEYLLCARYDHHFKGHL